MKCARIILTVALVLGLKAISSAAVPQLVNYQGMLTDSTGTPVTNGVYTIRLRIYDDSTAGSTLWEETMPVEITDGLFSVRLGEGVALPNNLFSAGVNRFLGVKVNLNAEFSPRTRLTSATYALQSMRSDSATVASLSLNLTCVDCVDATDLANNSVDSDNIVDGSIQFSDIGQNSATAGKVIKWNGSSWSAQNDSAGTESGWTDAGTIVNLTDSANNVGIGTATPYAKLHAKTNGGIGVKGEGITIGVDGQTSGASNSAGVSGAGYYGVVGNGTTYGLYGIGNSNGVYGAGITGVYGDGTNLGVQGNGSTGVYGTGSVVGVHGDGIGHGVYGRGGSTGGNFASNNTTTNVGYGIYASNGGNVYNYAGYFAGEVGVEGFLTKGGGGFKIDHPLDPANKYLYHSFVESPDMKNIYDGVVTLDESGEAEVTLPEWFDELNKDFRYQLTAIGAPGPNLYVAQKITTNQFRIAGGVNGMEVSWQVTGIRHDAFAEYKRLPVEKNKSAAERGKYLHPIEHGVSETLGLNYELMNETEAQSKRLDEERAKMKAERKLQEEQSANPK